MNLDAEREYASVVAAIRKHEDDLEALNTRKAALEEALVSAWADQGCQKVTVDGHTLYLRQDVYATTPQGKPAAVSALKASDFADIVKEDVNGNSLHALVREWVRDDTFPPELKEVLGHCSRWRIGLQKK